LGNRKKGLQRKTKDASAEEKETKLYSKEESSATVNNAESSEWSEYEMDTQPMPEVKPTALDKVLTEEYLTSLNGLSKEEIEARLGYKL